MHKWEPKSKKEKYTQRALTFAAIALVFWSALAIDIQWSTMGGLSALGSVIASFFPPDISYVPSLLQPAWETFEMAVVGTLAAIVMAVPVALISAKNITPSITIAYPIGRAIIVVSRSVHEIIWALIFVAALGLGPFAGTLALGFRSIGFLGKLLAEEIEGIDEGQIEAMRACGANQAQIILFAVLPQIKPRIIGLTIYRWDINFRMSTVLGIVGAGGIGYEIQSAMQRFRYSQAASVILVILVLVAIGEVVSARLREQVT